MTSLSRTFMRSRSMLLTCAAALAACSDPPTEPKPRVLPTLVVSDPFAAVGSAAPGGTTASTGNADLVFVSLPPGIIPDGDRAVIRNLRTGVTAHRPFADGGFDPIAIAAAVGDELEIRIVRIGGGEEVFHYKVPVRRPPRVVRTIPPRGKSDVPVNSAVTIVFSEPLEAGTLTSSSVRLLVGNTVVAGVLEFADADRLAVVFEPAARLMANTNYVIEVSGVRDDDGDVLDQPLSSDFTTGDSPLTGQVAYIGSAVDGWALYVMNAPGTPGTVVATPANRCCSGKPAWSPDGRRIAFVRGHATGWDIKIVNADGSWLTTLTDGLTPSWSPKGDRIAFSRVDTRGNFALFIVNVDGSNLVQLTTLAEGLTGYDMWPAWSPDGAEIVFSRHRQTDDPIEPLTQERWNGLFIIGVDGSGLRRLPISGMPWEAAWSPDGRRIAFAWGGGIALIDVDGTNLTTLPWATNFRDETPSWSPVGDRILFRREIWTEVNGQQVGLGNIWVMNADGSNQRQLTNSHLFQPSWSPVGPTP